MGRVVGIVILMTTLAVVGDVVIYKKSYTLGVW